MKGIEMTNIKWKPLNSDRLGYMGKIKIFSLNWDCCRSQNSDIPPYKLMCHLTGVKSYLGHFASLQEADVKAKKALQYFMVASGLDVTINNSEGI